MSHGYEDSLQQVPNANTTGILSTGQTACSKVHKAMQRMFEHNHSCTRCWPASNSLLHVS